MNVAHGVLLTLGVAVGVTLIEGVLLGVTLIVGDGDGSHGVCI